MTTQQILINNLNNLFERYNLTQTEVAQELGTSQSYIAQMLNGKGSFSNKRYDEIVSICTKLGRMRQGSNSKLEDNTKNPLQL